MEHAPWSDGLGGLKVVDLFAGSGAMGLEALSRGAAKALFVEKDRDAIAAIRANIDAMKLHEAAKLTTRDATALGNCAEEPFDVAFLDPPYHSDLGDKALASLIAGGWIKTDCLVIYERAAGEALLERDGFEVLDVRRYGAASVSFLRLGGS